MATEKDAPAIDASELSMQDSQAQEIPATEDIQTPQDNAKPEEIYDFDDEGGNSGTDGDEKIEDGQDKGQEKIEDGANGKPAKKKTPDENEFTDELFSRGEKAGLTRDELQEFGSPQAAEKALTLLEKRGAPAPAAGKTQQADGGDATKPAFEKFKITLDPEVFDPEILETVNGMNEHYAKQFELVMGQLTDARQSLSKQQALQFEAQFDSWIGQLGDGYKDVLGEGNGADMDKAGDQFKNRVKVLDEMEAIAAGYSRLGKEVPAYNELFNKALGAVFKDKQKEIVRKELSSKLGKRQIIARPSQRRGGNVDPEAAARSYVKQFLEEHDTAEPSTDIDF
ncbi:MAG: hypothetical protein A2Y07_01255 [Planctomycetes bacterium GWF2_50_10]|nr:MAG: hypothetical protein A2Y07_01255 [Planctomycetes bacterium GWF2_50_10]